MSKYTEQACDQRDTPNHSSHLFLVRVWLGKIVKGTPEIILYGRVQDVVTGQAHYFRGSPELAKVMLNMIPQSQIDRSHETAPDAEHEDQA